MNFFLILNLNTFKYYFILHSKPTKNKLKYELLVYFFNIKKKY